MTRSFSLGSSSPRRSPTPALDRVRYRGVALLLLLCCGLAALFPQRVLGLMEELIQRSRSPVAASRLAVLVSLACGALFALLLLWWDRAARLATRLIAWIAGRSRPSYTALLLAAAIVPRALVAGCLPHIVTSDGHWYHAAAISLASGHGLAVDGELSAAWPPGYPFLLSILYRAFGPHPPLAWIWGLAAAAIVIGAVHSIARRLYGAPTARLAALLVAAYPALALSTGQIMSDIVFLAGLLGLARLAIARRPCGAVKVIAAGALIGALNLTRGTALGLPIVIPAIWWLQRPRAQRMIPAVLLLLLAAALCLAPWTERNRRLYGTRATAINIGLNAYIGNHPGASGGFTFVPPPLPADPAVTPVQRDAALLRMAGDFVVDHPLEALLLVPKKLFHLYLLEASAAQAPFQLAPPRTQGLRLGLSAVTQVAYALALFLFLLRLTDLFVSRLRPRGIQWTGWIFIAYFTGLVVIFFGQDRFRLPILPWMLIEGSVLLARAAGTAVGPEAGEEASSPS